jgi:hypothetical protein
MPLNFYELYKKINENTKDLFSKSNDLFGWLSPKGILYECGFEEHSNIALDNINIKKYLSDKTLQLAKRLPPQESSVSMAIANDLYRVGFLRVGSDLLHHTNFDVYFQGNPEAIKNLYNKARAMAENRGGKAIFSRVFLTAELSDEDDEEEDDYEDGIEFSKY